MKKRGEPLIGKTYMNSVSAIGLSGLKVASTQLAVSANNVANALTDGFVPSTVAPEELRDGGVTATVQQEPDAMAEVRADRALLAPSRTDLAQEIVNQMKASRAYEANVASLRADSDTTRMLLDALKS